MNGSGSTILMIGASSDIGCEVIRTLDDENLSILAHYNQNIDKIQKLQATSKSEIIPLQADLTSEDEINNMLIEIDKLNMYPDKLVHLAAPRPSYIRFKHITWGHFQYALNVELRSIILILNHCLPHMVKQKNGRVVFILTSNCIGVPPKALSHYTTTKFALLGLMRSLAAEYADKSICINAVSPTMTETSFLIDFPNKLVEMTAAAHPQKRNAITKDIAPVIKFLLSKETAFITGANIPITGGTDF